MKKTDKDEVTVQELDLREEGDGFCMGFHGWKEGYFDDEAVAVPMDGG